MTESIAERHLTVQGAADYLGVQPLTIRRYIARGTLPAYRLGPKLMRVRIDDLDALLSRVDPAAYDPDEEGA